MWNHFSIHFQTNQQYSSSIYSINFMRQNGKEGQTSNVMIESVPMA